VIGITTTVPTEIIFAAGLRPIDLNNLFITDENPIGLVSQAEAAGFSHNICAWIKGIYSVVIKNGIEKIVAVTGGDCSNTIALRDVLERRGVQVHTFEYPLSRNREDLWIQMDRLRQALGTTWEEIEKTKSMLDRIRSKLRRLDDLSWQENILTGFENSQFLLNSSDFGGDPKNFEKDLDQFLFSVRQRIPENPAIRLGYIGVPPIFSRFYEYIESLGARVVFNEVQRQFSMPFDVDDIVDQYLEYTYPYAIHGRLKDIEEAIRQRQLDGLIHYTQMFCYRQIYDIIIRDDLTIPVLTLEGDSPGRLDGRTCLRIETFLEMLKGIKQN